MYFRSGHYIGDATTPRTITLNFQPKVVIVFPHIAEGAYFRTDDFPANESVAIGNYGKSNVTDCILSFTSTGFTVGNDDAVNGTNEQDEGYNYDYIAFGDDNNSDIYTLSYTGDGNDDRNITDASMGFTPDFALTIRTGTNDSWYAVWKTNDMPENSAVSMGAHTPTTNRIQSLIENGFQVGSDDIVNKNGSTFYAFCIKESSCCEFGTYEGDGTDNRNITGVGFDPDCVCTERVYGTTSLVEHNWQGEETFGDYSCQVTPDATIANAIQDLITDGFQIGTTAQVNAGAGETTYYYWAFLNNITPTADFSGTPRTGDKPLEVVFSDLSEGGVIDTWSWTFGDGGTSEEQNPTHTYTEAGSYDVSLTVTNTDEFSDTETKLAYIIVTEPFDSTVITYLDELAVRLEDTEEKVFTDETKLIALNRSQLQIAENLKPEYLQDLLEIESSADISSGEYSLSSLTYTLILDDQGIFGIKVTISDTDYWAYKIELKDVKRLDNPYYLPDYEVFYYIQNDKIYFKAGNGLSLGSATADIYYLKYPAECTLYVTPDLSDEYHWLWMVLAENYCWQMENRYDRAEAVGKIAQKEIEFINYKFKASPEIIMGD